MTIFRWALTAIVIGSLCIAAAMLWPEVPDPRAGWTDQKSADYLNASQEIHARSHDLAGAMDHATGDPLHVHSPTESIADPRLAALDLERAREHSAKLQAELEAARRIPPGWHLLLGLLGALLTVVGVVIALTTRVRM
ncbi:MAG: hypothetical protein WD851_21885 [Pirellulales bacterium]